MDKDYYKKYEPIFGAWYITKLLGEGSFGKVFEIERKDYDTVYKAALKVITVPQNSSEIRLLQSEGMTEVEAKTYFNSVVHNIMGEYNIMNKLKGNSNIVSYEDHTRIEHEDEIGWDILIRMELLTPLDKLVANNPFKISDVIRVGIDMCKALELCEKNNIIHRDIKPQNIFISPNGDYKLGDFGVARTIEQTISGMSKKGTSQYMAPEIYKGEAYGLSADIYSLGIVLYKLLNDNRFPFMPQGVIMFDDIEKAMIKRVSGNKVPNPKNGFEELWQIILKALEYDKASRYVSASDMRKDLEKLAGTYTDITLFNAVAPGVDIDEEELFVSGETEKTEILLDEPTDISLDDIFGQGTEVLVNERTETHDNPKVEKLVSEETENSIRDIVDQMSIYESNYGKQDSYEEPQKGKKSVLPIIIGGIAVVVIAIIAIFMMGGSGSTSTGSDSETVETVAVSEISNISDCKLTEGETKQLKPEITPSDYDGDIYYYSEDVDIATVDDSGNITAKKSGTTTIVVEAGEESKSISVAVTAKPTTEASTKPKASSKPKSTSKPKPKPKKKSNSSGGDFQDLGGEEFDDYN